jgi:hypothetical protein
MLVHYMGRERKDWGEMNIWTPTDALFGNSQDMLRYEPTTECKFYSKCQSAKHGKQPNWVVGKKFPTRFTKSKNGTRGKNSSKWKKMKSQHLYLFFLAFVADICICIYIFVW